MKFIERVEGWIASAIEGFGNLLIGTLVVLVVYVMVSMWAFSWRHPWMTDREVWIHVGDAITWSNVDYDEARRR